ncbi:MAG: hypothetical protein ACLRVU_09675 [Beduini sp.]|uniref:hypothetical protein n=1 Tax=Beduini sp. TaxID=1922300 RepID=UPI00399F835B
MKYDELIERIAEKTSEKTSTKVIKKLKRENRIRYNKMSSFTRTENVLKLYPKLPEDNSLKKRIKTALEEIKDDEYYGIIESIYSDMMTIKSVSEFYNVKTTAISYHKVRLVRKLAMNLFPEEVAKELLEDFAIKD